MGCSAMGAQSTFNRHVVSSILTTPTCRSSLHGEKEMIILAATTKIKGDIGVSIIIKELIKHGVAVSIPFGDKDRYDLIGEFNGK